MQERSRRCYEPIAAQGFYANIDVAVADAFIIAKPQLRQAAILESALKYYKTLTEKAANTTYTVPKCAHHAWIDFSKLNDKIKPKPKAPSVEGQRLLAKVLEYDEDGNLREEDFDWDTDTGAPETQQTAKKWREAAGIEANKISWQNTARVVAAAVAELVKRCDANRDDWVWDELCALHQRQLLRLPDDSQKKRKVG